MTTEPKSPEEIAQIVAADQHSDEIHDTVDRNVRHLQQCLMLTHIVENATTEDKIAFADAVTLGEDWINLTL